MVVLHAQDHQYKHSHALSPLVLPTVLGVLGVLSLLVQTHVEAITLKVVILFQSHKDRHVMELVSK